MGAWRAYINLDGGVVVEAAHMAFREQAVGEEGQQDKLGQGQQLVSAQDEAGAPQVHGNRLIEADIAWEG